MVVCHGVVIATLLDFYSEDIKLCGIYEFKLKNNEN